MPELPEVEEVRRTLEPHLLGAEIAGVRVYRADFITPRGAPLKKLIGRRFVRTLRHGKKLFCVADDGQTLVIHLGMSGRVDSTNAGAPLLKHTHVSLVLGPGAEIRFRDPRRFGGVWYYANFSEAWESQTRALGPDALALKPEDLAKWRTMKGRLKQRLLSQKDVAGLGNIYVDEALWAARLHPRQRVNRIASPAIKTLVAAIHKVLERSIQSGGTTLRDYRNVLDQPGSFALQLQAYGRGGGACGRCGSAMKSARIATRATVFCPTCQRCR